MNGEQAKLFAHLFSTAHRAGRSVVQPIDGEALHGAQAFVVVGEPLTISGREIPEKAVKRLLWEMRDKRALKRPNACVWSVWHEGSGVSYLGVGALVMEDVVARWQRMRRAAAAIELAEAA